MTNSDAKRVLEAALMCSSQALSLREIDVLLAGAVDAAGVQDLLAQLQQDWLDRGLQLVQVAGGWRFQSRADVAPYLERLNPEKPPKYSRATLETLAIIAYRQPVTRGDMEDIRGVAINAHIIKQLEERGWIEVIGHKETLGRPALFATTPQFLADLGLRSLSMLPAQQEAGLGQARAQSEAIGEADGFANSGAETAQKVLPMDEADTAPSAQPFMRGGSTRESEFLTKSAAQ
jgi:segregation and condensation protein B